MITYKNLKGVSTVDCGDSLLSIQECLPSVLTQYQNKDILPYAGDVMLLRKGALERLHAADSALRIKYPYLKLLVVYGYRHPEIQEKQFWREYNIIKARNPGMSEYVLLEETHKLIAVPPVAGHPTGGAVDVTLIMDNSPLDMGTGIADFDDTEKIQVFSQKVSKKQSENRLILRSLMAEAGFAPFDGEWWHFSYGDKEWAYYYNKPFAMYDQLDLRR